jgi:hypothetical protein
VTDDRAFAAYYRTQSKQRIRKEQTMTDRKTTEREPDALELETETVSDLEPTPEAADEIRGGRCYAYVTEPPSGTTNYN